MYFFNRFFTELLLFSFAILFGLFKIQPAFADGDITPAPPPPCNTPYHAVAEWIPQNQVYDLRNHGLPTIETHTSKLDAATGYSSDGIPMIGFRGVGVKDEDEPIVLDNAGNMSYRASVAFEGGDLLCGTVHFEAAIIYEFFDDNGDIMPFFENRITLTDSHKGVTELMTPVDIHASFAHHGVRMVLIFYLVFVPDDTSVIRSIESKFAAGWYDIPADTIYFL